MSNSQMTPRWVVENFLPDYKTRYEEFLAQYPELKYGLKKMGVYQNWCIEHLPEALSELLKAQREVCAKAAGVERVIVGCNHTPYGVYNEFGYHVNTASILNAHIPEPKNRK